MIVATAQEFSSVISQPKHFVWELERTVSMRQFRMSTQNICPRARNRFNQVVLAKRFEGVFLFRKCAEFKNQTLNKSAGTQNCYSQLNTPRVSNI